MMDFKIKSVVEDGKETVATIAFYKGAVTTEDELDTRTGEMTPVTRYRRSAYLGKREVRLAKGYSTATHAKRLVLAGTLKRELKARADEEGEQVIQEQV